MTMAVIKGRDNLFNIKILFVMYNYNRYPIPIHIVNRLYKKNHEISKLPFSMGVISVNGC